MATADILFDMATYISSDNPTEQYTALDVLQLATNGIPDTNRIVLRTDLLAHLTETEFASISALNVWLVVLGPGDATYYEISAYPISPAIGAAMVDGGITWNQYKSGSAWPVSGALTEGGPGFDTVGHSILDPTIRADTAFEGNGGLQIACGLFGSSIETITQDGKLSLLIVHIDEVGTNFDEFATLASDVHATPGNRPFVRVTYTPDPSGESRRPYGNRPYNNRPYVNRPANRR